MTFSNYETSRALGNKVYLYQFFYINEEQFLYTNHTSPLTQAGFDQPFLPQPITHGNVTSSGTLDKAQLEVTAPRTLVVADYFRSYPPNEVVNLIIRERHLDDPADQALAVWSGRVLGVSWESDGSQVKFQCEPVTTSMRRVGLRRNYQLGCPHVLYGEKCLASKLAATTDEIIVESVSPAKFKLPLGWLPTSWSASGKTVDRFVGGMATWTYEASSGTVTMKRTILRVENETDITVAGPVTGLVAGKPVRLILGCNHQMADCKNVHNNVRNFGGQPWIPLKTPFGFTNQFY